MNCVQNVAKVPKMFVIITTPLVSTDPDKRVEVNVRYEGKILTSSEHREAYSHHVGRSIFDGTSYFKLQTSNPLHFK
jgi:hypothetical protein